MRRTIVALVLVLVVALLAAGCGGDDDKSSDASSSAKTSVTTASDGSSDGGSSSGAGFAATKKCRDAALAYTRAVASANTAITGKSEDFQKNYQDFKEFADAQAPEEIRDEMKTVVETYADYVAKLKDAGNDQGKLQDAIKKLQDTDFQEAATKVGNWFAKECGAGS